MIQSNATGLRKGRAAGKGGQIQDLLHLFHAGKRLSKGGGQFLQGQDLGEIHPAYIGKKQKYAAGNASPEEKQAAYWNHQHHSALQQQQKGGIGRSRLVCDQVPDPVLLLNGMGKLLEGAATHVIRFDQPHTGDVLNHHGIKAYQGAVDIGQDPLHSLEDDRHHNAGQGQRDQGDQGQRVIDGEQIQENHNRSCEIGHKFRQVVGQKQFQLLDVLIENGLDRACAPLVQGSKRHFGKMLRYHAPHSKQRPIGSLVRQHTRSTQQHQSPHGARRDQQSAVGDNCFGTGAGEHRIHQPVNADIRCDDQNTAAKGTQNGQDQPFPFRPGPLQQPLHR